MNASPGDALAEAYYQGLSVTQGGPAKDARLVIGAVIIKHKLCLSDRETVAQIQDDSKDGGGSALSGTSAENPYLQYFVGLPGYQMEAPFVPSLSVEIRKRMGQAVFDVFQSAVIDAVDKSKRKPAAKGKTRAEEPKDDDDPPASSDSHAQGAEPEPEHQGKLLLDAQDTSWGRLCDSRPAGDPFPDRSECAE